MNYALTGRTVKVAKAVIELYAKRGTSPQLKEVAYLAYGQFRGIVRRDIEKLCKAGILKIDPHYGLTSVRPAPGFRIPFEDETGKPADASEIVARLVVSK
jgi:hypothetical protein